MRSLMYKVINDNGNEFITRSYFEATKKGNHIVEHLLVKEDTEDEKVKEAKRKHAHKVMEKFGIKRR